MRRLLAALAFAVLARPIAAQADETELVRVTVVSVSGRSVFLDQGRGAGLEPGMLVRLFPPGGAPVEGRVAAASTNSARVDLPAGAPVPPVGTHGELDVPSADSTAPPAAEPEPAAPPAPEHPPWSAELPDLDADTPLLAPATRQAPRDRPRDVSGRLYTNLRNAIDDGGDRDARYTVARAGVWAEVANPFGRGGRLGVAGALDHRAADPTGAPDDRRTDVRLDRLSYAIGGEAYAPYRLEVGRFLSGPLPELGLVDGVEVAAQWEGGLRTGVGGGAYPVPLPDRATGDDVGFHVFADYESPTPGACSAALGYQKTWHEGAADRDQIVAHANAAVGDTWRVYGAVRADVYTSADHLKGAGVGLTELWLQARYTARSSRWGAGASCSHYEWPELRREEFAAVPDELVRDGRVDRLGASAWLRPAKPVRLSARLDGWDDHEDSGAGGELAVDLDQRGTAWPALHAAVFVSDGRYTDGVGARAEARRSIGAATVGLGYEWFRTDVTTSVGGEDTLVRRLVRADVAWGRGPWSASVGLDYDFGDAEHGWALGAYGAYRF